ncbi:FG-GAP repeat domain-containing protein [Streptomyces sp. NPDC056222]|uniref:FG-GAP repeat domain-containing protein n=1 Tax=Streptomyces sp. NPDC056222 TaxID=3345749 RepID=UPI0035E3AF6F
MAWYSYWAGHDTMFTFTANVRGGFNAPFPAYQLQAGWWDVKDAKYTTGDYNGDGRDDIAALYGYPNGDLKQHTFLAQPNGGFNGSTTSWQGNATTWGSWSRTYPHGGDFNGDGLDDITFWYDYADGHDAMIMVPANSNRDGGFSTMPPPPAWQSAAGNWTYSSIKIVPGDYDGDGRDDIGSQAGYSDGTVRMWTHLSSRTASFSTAKGSWASTGAQWEFSRGTFLRPYTY